MAFKFNPTTGNLDIDNDTQITPSKTYTLESDNTDRAINAATTSQDEIANVLMTLIRDLAEKNIILLTATATPISIKRGQPIGLMGVTYANDVS